MTQPAAPLAMDTSNPRAKSARSAGDRADAVDIEAEEAPKPAMCMTLKRGAGTVRAFNVTRDG
jgi:hypothetical protein